MPQVISRPSPNWNARPPGVLIDLVVLHATEDEGDEQGAIDWLCNPQPDHPERRVSAHIVIGRDGTIYELVDPRHRAWHAGPSQFGNRPDCNSYSIGIELANRCDGKEAFPDAQLAAAAQRVAEYMKEWPAITTDRITRHSDIALPVGRKRDPGPLFPFGDFLEMVKEELSRC